MTRNILIDAGAGAGQNVNQATRGEFDEVILIEPHPYFAGVLRQQYAGDSSIKVIDKPLVVDVDPARTFNMVRPPRWSSLYRPQGLRAVYPGLAIVEQQSLEQVSIGQLISAMENAQITLNLDCCGNELALIESAMLNVCSTSRIAAIRVVIASGEPDFETSATRDELTNCLSSYHFDLTQQDATDQRRLSLRFSPSAMEASARAHRPLPTSVEALREALEKSEAEREMLHVSLDEMTKTLTQKTEDLETALEALSETRERLNGLEHLEAILGERAGAAPEGSNADAILKAIQDLEHSLERRITRSSESSVRQIESYIGVRDFFDTGSMMLDFHGWPISSEIGLFLLRQINAVDYDCIVEFGSGTSTLMFAEAILKKSRSIEMDASDSRQIEDRSASRRTEVATSSLPPSEFDVPRRIVSFEHHKKYLNKTADLLRSRDVLKIVDLVYAPLVTRNISGEAFLYYSCESKLQAIASVFDGGEARFLILIDGPPQQTGPRARFPAMSVLLEYFSRYQMDIVVDDYARESEHAMVEEWKSMLDERSIIYEADEIAAEKGGYFLRINP